MLKRRRSYDSELAQKPIIDKPMGFDTPGSVVVSEYTDKLHVFTNCARLFEVEIKLKPLPDI